MKIISFAWTTAPLLAGHKTMTWREWNPKYAASFKPGEIVQAWDKLPRAGGQRIGLVRIISIDQAETSDMLASDYEAEGMAWLAAHPEAWPKAIFGKVPTAETFSREAFEQRRREPFMYSVGYIVRFQWIDDVAFS